MSSQYLGYKLHITTPEESARIYTDLQNNKFDCLPNQYLICIDSRGNVIDKFLWTGEYFRSLNYHHIDSSHIGKISPRNLQQELAMDMLQNDDITVKCITGGYGTGKDYLMLGNALDLVMKKGKYEKLLWVRNNIDVKDTVPLGALPGTAYQKLQPWAMVIADHVGGIDAMESMIDSGRIEICHLGWMRGRDIRNSLVYCTEAENLSSGHMKLLLGRIGDGSCLYINGDYRQVDKKIFETDNGLMTAIDRLKGNPLFGYVKLEKTERSKTAALADLLD